MAFTDGADVAVGDPTKETDHDSLADNTEFNRDLLDVEHDFDISTGDGSHKSITMPSAASISWASNNMAITHGTGYVNLSSGKWFINDTANAKLTVGLTLNQGANDDEILAFKSSDVAHGITGIAETDTYGFFKKFSATDGGLRMEGLTEGSTAVYIIGTMTSANATKSTSGIGTINLFSELKSGTGATASGADANLVSIQDHTGAGSVTRFLFDAEGSGHADVEWTTYSDARLKSNFAEIPYGLREVLALEAQVFDKESGFYDEDGGLVLEGNKRRMVGFVAQKVRDLMPLLVKELPNKQSFYTLDYGRFTPVLWRAVQELAGRVTSLEAN